MQVGIVATSNRHKYVTTSVRDMFTSALFRHSVTYSEQNHDKTFVLSASKGLIKLNDTISPVDCYGLNDVLGGDYHRWLRNTAHRLKEIIPTGTELFFYTGSRYRRLVDLLDEYICHSPLQGLKIGQQEKWFLERIN